MYGESRCQSLLGIKGLKELKATHYLRPLLHILFSFCKEMHNGKCAMHHITLHVHSSNIICCEKPTSISACLLAIKILGISS